MPPAAPARSAEQIAKAAEWRQTGNEAFREKKWTQALACYTEAIALDPACKEAYSNRSAAYIALKQLAQAEHDANRAIALDPQWAKAYRRKATALTAQHRHHDAAAALAQALGVLRADTALAPAARARELAEVQALLNQSHETIRRSAQGRVIDAADVEREAAGPKLFAEGEARRRRGERVGLVGAWPPTGSARYRLWMAEQRFREAKARLDQYATNPDGSISGPVQTLNALTNAMFEDVRVARLDMDDIQRLAMCFRLEQHARDALEPTVPPAQIVQQYKERLDRAPTPEHPAAGWDHVRPALQYTIRERVMGGFLTGSLMASPEKAIPYFEYAGGVIEEARKLWPDVPAATRGMSLTETFLRGVRVAQAESMISNYSRNMDNDPAIGIPKKTEYLNRLVDVGQWLVDSFKRDPHPPAEYKTPDNMHNYWAIYYAHYAAPRAAGHLALGFAYGKLANMTRTYHQLPGGRIGPYTLDGACRAQAATHYATATAWMPPDDPQRAVYLWFALEQHIKRGAYFLGDVAVLRDVAAKATTFCGDHWPPSAMPDETSPGKVAALELAALTAGQPAFAMPGPHLEWGPLYATRTPAQRDFVTAAVMQQMTRAEGHGVLMLTEVVRRAWRERVDVYGEMQQAVGAADIWAKVDRDAREEWDEVLLPTMKAFAAGQGLVFFGGWTPPENAAPNAAAMKRMLGR